MALTIQGSGSAAGTSVTLPTHAVGDLIVILAYRDGNATAPTKPTAGGTVPAWVDINAGAGANSNSSRSAFFVATATNHTSGTWTNATGMAAVVFRGQDISDAIGASAVGGGTANGSATSPNITPEVTDGTSIQLHCHMHRTVTAWNAAPSGFTRVTSVATELAINTRDDTSVGTGVAQTATTTNSGYRGETIEILAEPPSPMIGTSSLVLAGDGVMIGSGTLLGTASNTFTEIGVLSGSGDLSGTASLILTEIGALLGIVAFSGSSTLNFTELGELIGSGTCSGTVNLGFSENVVLIASAELFGTSLLVFAQVPLLTGTGEVVGASSCIFSEIGALSGDIAVQGESALNMTGSGTLPSGLVGNSTLFVTETGILIGLGALLGATVISFTESGSLLGNGSLIGTSSVNISEIGVLIGSGSIMGMSNIAFTNAGVLGIVSNIEISEVVQFNLYITNTYDFSLHYAGRFNPP